MLLLCFLEDSTNQVESKQEASDATQEGGEGAKPEEKKDEKMEADNLDQSQQQKQPEAEEEETFPDDGIPRVYAKLPTSCAFHVLMCLDRMHVVVVLVQIARDAVRNVRQCRRSGAQLAQSP